MRRIIAVVALAIISLSNSARGEDFRIDTKVFNGDRKEPVSQTTTLFKAGRVYDYLGDPTQVAVFDKPGGRFRLLDPKRRIQTEVNISSLLDFSKELQDKAAGSANNYLKFVAHPTFEPEVDDDSGELKMASSVMTYKVETEKPKSSDVSQQYREFSDWYARLNAMMNPGSQPPFPRLAVNEELAKRGLVASKVTLVIPAQVQRPSQTLSSQHKINYRLLPKDEKTLKETDAQLASFKHVKFDEFQKTTTK